MTMEVTISGVDFNQETVRKVNREVSGNWKRVGKYVPLVITNVWMAHFKEQGKRFGGWKQPGIWTKLIRAKGSKKMYRSLAEVQADNQLALVDTGLLRMSFTPTSPNSDYGFGERMVWGGSKLQKARTLSDGGTSEPFKFGAQQESRLEKNFSKTSPGSKPKKTPTGRKSRAKKNWNPEYFITLASMRKASKSGKTFKIPARKIELDARDLTNTENDHITAAIDRGIQDIVQGMVK